MAMLALDQFVFWVNAETPYKTAKDYVDAIKAGGPNKFKMGGTGSKQEDQIITVAIEKATGVKMIYVPFKGGGESRCNWSASTSIRPSTIRSRPWRSGAPAACARYACSTMRACRTRPR